MTAVLVDTSVWSLSLRRRTDRRGAESHPAAAELEHLIDVGEPTLIGAIRQEALSGISDELLFVRLRRALARFPDLVVETPDYIEAARYHNTCRARRMLMESMKS